VPALSARGPLREAHLDVAQCAHEPSRRGGKLSLAALAIVAVRPTGSVKRVLSRRSHIGPAAPRPTPGKMRFRRRPDDARCGWGLVARRCAIGWAAGFAAPLVAKQRLRGLVRLQRIFRTYAAGWPHRAAAPMWLRRTHPRRGVIVCIACVTQDSVGRTVERERPRFYGAVPPSNTSHYYPSQCTACTAFAR
jgi:hypothetical protein